MCFSSPQAAAPVAPAAAPPAPAPLAEQVSPTYNAQQEQTDLYGAGGQPNMMRSDPSTTSTGAGAGGAGINPGGSAMSGVGTMK